MTTPAISVLLVDDHAVVREGYRRLLELSPDMRVAGEAADAMQAYQRFCALQPDVVVMAGSHPLARSVVHLAIHRVSIQRDDRIARQQRIDPSLTTKVI